MILVLKSYTYVFEDIADLNFISCFHIRQKLHESSPHFYLLKLCGLSAQPFLLLHRIPKNYLNQWKLTDSNLINADLGLAINAFSVSIFIYLSLMYSGIYITGLLSILLPFSSSSLNSPSLEDMLSSDSDDPSEELSPDLLSSEDEDLLRFARFASAFDWFFVFLSSG